MSNLQSVIVTLSVSYALIGALLLVVLVYARLPWPAKAFAVVVTSAFYVVSFNGARGLLGWATTGQPVAATVKVQKLNPTAQVIFDDKVVVDHTGDEKTALRFKLDSAGKVIDVARRPKSLLETFRNVRANGADIDPKTRVRVLRP